VLLLLDHRDSFTFNLVQALRGLGADVRVERAEELELADVLALTPERVLLGPGPGPPERASLANELFRCGRVPALGVCLGHQSLAWTFGARVVRGPRPVHGHADRVVHEGRGVFRGLPDPLTVGRYHSLVVEEPTLPACLEVSARTSDGAIAGLAHRSLPLHGVQFHPESILSEHGERLLANFLAL
jgi:anthranilate synthase/aminodeoxychorismate synthase-like glutamine amidotransferase